MNTSTIQTLLFAVVVCFCLPTPVKAQAIPSHYHMAPEILQAIAKMRETKADAEVLQALSAIQDRAERVTQVFLASLSVLDLEQRSGVVALVFQLPIADDGLNIAHLPLLVNLYVQSARSPLPYRPRPRSFIDDSVLQSRLLDILASLLHAESARTSLAPGEPVHRLLELLEAAHGIPALPALDQKMIENVIVALRDVENTGRTKKEEQEPTLPPNRMSNEQSMLKEFEVKHIAPTPSEAPDSLTSRGIIVVLIVAVTGLLWLLLKRRK